MSLCGAPWNDNGTLHLRNFLAQFDYKSPAPICDLAPASIRVVSSIPAGDSSMMISLDI